MATDSGSHPSGARDKSHLRTVFQFASEVGGEPGRPPEEVFAAAARVVVRWVSRKFPRSLPSCAYNLGGFELNHLGLQHVLTVSLPTYGVWSMRLVHPDAPFQGHAAVAGRTWTTEVALQGKADAVRVAVRVMCASAEYAQEPIVLTRPGVVRDLACQVGLRDIRGLDGQPWMLQTEADLAQFYEFVASPHRVLPVVMLTQPTPGALWGKVAPYLLDHEALARECLGVAHVACMPADLGYAWTARVGKPWSAFAGTVRTYQPGVDFESGSPFNHPLVLAERVMFWTYWTPGNEKLEGEAAFAAFLVNALQRQANTRALDRGGCLFVVDARALQTKLERERIEREFGQRADQEAAAILQVQLAELKRAHEEELAALREQLGEAEEARDVALELADAAEKEREDAQRESHNLRTQNTALRLALEEKQGGSADADMVIPATLAELPDWVETQLAGRLVLHPRALRGLKGARYENVSLVYEALLLLAREYRDMRLGVGDAEGAWTARREELGLRFSRAISESRAGEQGAEYFVNYPARSTRRVFVEHHLAQGATKDERFCLRIYFFWDTESSQVVVAHLPSHLDTRAT